MAILFSQPLLKVYRASYFSCSFVFCLFLFLVAIILPFFLAFSTYDFWKERQIYTEQPQVLYKKELIVMVYSETESIVGSSIVITPSTQIYSSIGSINNIFFENISPMLITSTLLDYNFDNLADMYDFNITVYLNPRGIRNVKIISFYEYKIRSRIKMDMICLAYADVNTVSGASKIYIDGDLNFQQIQPIKATQTTQVDYNTTVLSFTSVADDFLPLLLLRYNDRNYTTKYDYNQPLVVPLGFSDKSIISMKVRIPQYQEFEYAPSFLEVMKFAWIQYICLLIPVGYLIYRFAGFIFRNQILESHVTYEIKIIK